MIKRCLSVLLALTVLSLSAAALAAPSRDERTSVGNQALRDAVSLFMGASLLRGVEGLNAGESPSQALIEGTLLLGFSRSILPSVDGDYADGTETVPDDVTEIYLSELFAAPAPIPTQPTCPCITRQEGALYFDFTDLESESSVGAHIFSVTDNGSTVTVLADLFTSVAFAGEPIETLPEDGLNWEYTAQITLEKNSDSQFGYRLIGYRLSPEWLDGALVEWRTVSGADYEASIPSILTVDSLGGAEDTFATADGSASLVIRTLNGAGGDRLQAARNDYAASHPGARIVYQGEVNLFTGETSGEYTICFAPEGVDTVRLLTLSFPAERQDEFSFYGEIIRNAFWCDGLGNG
ncbi:MAG: hypothetical protein IJ240_05475 [Clostridia bacterium]|nr:hypothetical protein [Clostridia bacterium]